VRDFLKTIVCSVDNEASSSFWPLPFKTQMDSSCVAYAPTASTMAHPPNDGMGCYINAVLIAAFGPNQPWLTAALTTPRVNDSAGVTALRQAVAAYGQDLRYRTHGGKVARPETIRHVLREWPKLAPGLAQEAAGFTSSSAGEFLSLLLDKLVPPQEQLLETTQERLEWNDAHAAVVFDRYFRWLTRSEDVKGPSETIPVAAPSWSHAVFEDLSRRPASFSSSKPQTSAYLAAGTNDFPVGTQVSMANLAKFSLLATLDRPSLDFYLDHKVYRVGGQPLLGSTASSTVSLDKLLEVAKDLVPSFQTEVMSQKMIHFIRDLVQSGDKRLDQVAHWLTASLGLGTPLMGQRIHREKDGQDKVVLLLGILIEAFYLVGKPHVADEIYRVGREILGDQGSWALVHGAKRCLDEAGRGKVYVAPGELTGATGGVPRWIFTTRTKMVLKPSPSFDVATTGLVINVTPSPGRQFAMLDAMDGSSMTLTLDGPDGRPVTLRLVGVVEYFGTRRLTPSDTSHAYGYHMPHQAAGHYRSWFYSAPTPHDRRFQWFVYDDLKPAKGPIPLAQAHLGQVIHSWSTNGVAFFYVGADTPEVAYKDTEVAACRLGSSSHREDAPPKEDVSRRILAFLGASPGALHTIKLATTKTHATPRLGEAFGILFPVLHESFSAGDYPEWDLDAPSIGALASSSRWQEVQKHAMINVSTLWGLTWTPSEEELVIKDAARFERVFVHDKTTYHLVGRILTSLGEMDRLTGGEDAFRSALAVLVGKDLLANPSSLVRRDAEFLRRLL